MPILSIEAIRENPWNAVTHSLPSHPTSFFLELVHLAATYCRTSEYLLMTGARDGSYTPHGWEANDNHPDAHEESEARSCEADRRLAEICHLLTK
jgi:hypothetical protein